MKECKQCGCMISDSELFCTMCGTKYSEEETVENKVVPGYEGEASGAWTFLGFCFPLLGFILFLSMKATKPSISRKTGKGALIGVIVSAVIYTFYFIAIFASM